MLSPPSLLLAHHAIKTVGLTAIAKSKHTGANTGKQFLTIAHILPGNATAVAFLKHAF